jgi:hypothetical protein
MMKAEGCKVTLGILGVRELLRFLDLLRFLSLLLPKKKKKKGKKKRGIKRR